MIESLKIFGTLLLQIRYAKPSAIAVFPTPDSPTSNGLFFVLLDRIWIRRSTSLVLPIKLSILSSLTRLFKFIKYAFSSVFNFSCSALSSSVVILSSVFLSDGP